MNPTKHVYGTTQERIVQLIVAKEALVKQLKSTEEQLSAALREMPLGSMFQGPDGVVYQTIAPSGTFVSFKNIDYIRTRREGETKGTLSIKAAREAGFSVSGGEA